MINPDKPFSVSDVIEVFRRRIWFVVLPFVAVMAGVVLFAFFAPREYKATTLILVSPQKVPEQFVKATVTSRIEERLQSISQEILSRTQLEKVIAEFKLYPDEVRNGPLESIVELMRKNIEIEIPKKDKEKNYFTISYIGKNPQVVTTVTNKLASLFIEENLRVREQQARGTSEFLTVELNATKAKLEEQEKAITTFKRQNMGELPEQKDANLKVLDQLQQLHQRVSENLRSAQDRKMVIQKQLADTELMAASLASRLEMAAKEAKEEPVSPTSIFVPAPPSPTSAPAAAPTPAIVRVQQPPRPPAKERQEIELEQMRIHLMDLQAKYTSKHPDILLTKRKIADLEKKVEKIHQEREAEEKRQEALMKDAEEKAVAEAKAIAEAKANGTPLPPVSVTKVVSAPPPVARAEAPERREERQELNRLNGRRKEIESQLVAAGLEIDRLREEEGKVRGQLGRYRDRIENTPLRELAMADLVRDNANTRESYQTLLKKSQEAQQAENMEQRQKGEQFRIIDPARVPEKPFKPDMMKIMLAGLFLAVAGGLGTAFLREQMDHSFRDAADLETTLGLRVLVNVPKIKQKAA
jgi:uncharacterized protein involved in exopolysaccharide biosynthesis